MSYYRRIIGRSEPKIIIIFYNKPYLKLKQSENLSHLKSLIETYTMVPKGTKARTA